MAWHWKPAIPNVASWNYYQFGTAVDIVFLLETVLEKPLKSPSSVGCSTRQMSEFLTHDHSKHLKAISQKIVYAYQNLYSIGYDAVEWVSSVYLPRINFGMDKVTIREVIVNQCNEVNEQNDLACWA